MGDVETLKALADPLRLAILRVLMLATGDELPVRSVKELSAELDEPITKLYRHVKTLAACGLIEVAESNLVSGIVERRYRAAQASLYLDTTLVGADAEEVLAVDIASFDRTREDYVTARRRGPHPERRPLVASVGVHLDPARFAEFRDRLTGLVEELAAKEHPDGGLTTFFCAFFEHPH